MTDHPTTTARHLRLLVVDDHPVFRQGLTSLLESQTDMQVIGAVGSGAEAMAIVGSSRPDVVLLDMRLGEEDGLDVLEQLSRLAEPPRVLVISSNEGDVMVARALRAGAGGYVSKNAPAQELLNAIRDVARGGRFVSRELAARVDEAAGLPTLTERESEILSGVAAGLANKEIGAELGLTEKTVKNHLNRIFTKLDASDRTHAVMIALERGILTPPR